MTDAFQARVAAVDAALLTPLVQAALQDPTLEIKRWQVDTLTLGGGGAAGGVLGLFRVRGEAYEPASGCEVPWSLILKAFGGGSNGGADPSAWNYWKREPLVYQSGLLDRLPAGGLTTPRCYAVTDHGDDEFWIWLEDIPDPQTRWSLERFGQAARHLGQFNGAYLDGFPLPEPQPWFTWGRVRTWCDLLAPFAEHAPQYAGTPLGKQIFRGDALADTLELWAQHPALLEAFERLPVCFCHHDAFRRNLLARSGGDHTVAIDWAITGFGRIGEEAGATTAISLTWMDAAASAARGLDQAVFGGYVEGLHDASWQGDVRQARLGYLVNAAYPLGLGWMLAFLESLQQEESRRNISRMIGAPLDDIVEQWAEIQPFLLDLGAEALQLADELGCPRNHVPGAR